MALTGHANGAEQCLLSGSKQTWLKDGVMSAYDPKRSSRDIFGQARSPIGSKRVSSNFRRLPSGMIAVKLPDAGEA
jgi:hypothetical protein